MSRKLILFWDMFFIPVKASCRSDKKIFLSEFIFLVLRKIFWYFLDLGTYFSNQESISQYVLRHLQCKTHWNIKSWSQGMLEKRCLSCKLFSRRCCCLNIATLRCKKRNYLQSALMTSETLSEHWNCNMNGNFTQRLYLFQLSPVLASFFLTVIT